MIVPSSESGQSIPTRWPGHVSRTAALLVVLVSAAVIGGWIFEVDVLTAAARGCPRMSPATALTFALAGAALGFTLLRPGFSAGPAGVACRYAVLARTLAGAVVLIGLARLFLHFLRSTSNFDALGLSVALGKGAYMSPMTALNFVLLGLALLAINQRHFLRAYECMIALAGLIGWLGFAQYLYGGEPLPPFAQMEAHTTSAFLVLCAGLLCSRTDGGLMALLTSESIGGVTMRRLLPPALLAPVVLGWLGLEGQRAGWYGTEAGLSLLAISNVLLFALLVWSTAEELRRADLRRQQAESELKASVREVADLKAALDEHAIVAFTDPQGHITFVNDKFCGISKYTREELLGQDHRIINSGYHSKEFIRDIWSTIAHGRVWHGEIRNRAKDGTFYWVDTTIVPFLNDRGKPRQYVAIRADITERKLAEEKLRASLREVVDLKTALDEHAIVAITDASGKINYVNDKFCAISRYTRAELLGQDHRIVNSRHHPPEFFRDLWSTIGKGHVWHGEIRNRAKDGTYYWVDTTIVPFLNEHGKPRQYVAIRADITEQRHATEQLSASLKEVSDLKAALDEHAIVAITDARGRITFVNDKFCAISKFSRAELIGQDHRIINSGYHPKQFIRDLWTTISGGGVWHGQIRNRAKDGSFYWVDTTIVPFLNPDGKPRQYVAIRADITERKRAEEELRQAKEGLEQKVAERTSELQAAKERAESADRMKSEFLAAMSHELRTPLNGIIGFTELLHDERPGPLNPKQKRFSSEVLKSSRHLLQLINDILDLSKVEAGRMEIQPELLDLAQLVSDLCVSTAPLAEQKRIALSVETRRIAAPVILDPKKTKQILYNLVSNAIKFTPEGGSVTISAWQTDAGTTSLEVRDTGIGIKPEDIRRLFVEFQQIATGKNRGDQGTGLGLALTRKLVELQGGSIAVQSEPEKGSVFTITFPHRAVTSP